VEGRLPLYELNSVSRTREAGREEGRGFYGKRTFGKKGLTPVEGRKEMSARCRTSHQLGRLSFQVQDGLSAPERKRGNQKNGYQKRAQEQFLIDRSNKLTNFFFL